MQVLVRVFGSWITACSILVLALVLSGRPLTGATNLAKPRLPDGQAIGYLGGIDPGLYTGGVEPNDSPQVATAMNPFRSQGSWPTRGRGIRHRTDTPIATGAAFVQTVRATAPQPVAAQARPTGAMYP